MTNSINWSFLRDYIPHCELEALKEHAGGEEKEHFIELLARVEKQIKGMPKLYDLADKYAPEITVGMHYFGGATDFWIYELDQESLEGFGFVCLCGMTENAELGHVYVPEILTIPFIELDLYWDDKTVLADIMKKVNGE